MSTEDAPMSVAPAVPGAPPRVLATCSTGYGMGPRAF
jgi:hypothetical protein